MRRNPSIGRVRQADFCKRRPSSLCWFFGPADEGQETFDNDLFDFLARELLAQRSANQPGPTAQHSDRMLVFLIARVEEPLLGDPALLPQYLKLERVQLWHSRGDSMRQREIHIVAAQQ